MDAVPNGTWHLAQVASPHVAKPVQVIAAREIPYLTHSNRLQTLNIYLIATPETTKLVGIPVTSIPIVKHNSSLPQWQVHVHGGAWRDDHLTATSIEAAVAHTFSAEMTPITMIASINYTNSPFPNVPSWLGSTPYDPIKNNHSDPAREAIHPQHVKDVLCGFAFLQTLGLVDGSYILTGHSAGACLVFQSVLQSPSHYGLDHSLEPPRPAAIIGMNGLYDFLELVYGLGSTHEHLSAEYKGLLSIAFGTNEDQWPEASPARFDAGGIFKRMKELKVPQLVVLDQSLEDQLVPVNQADRFETHLRRIEELQVVRGHRCTGVHAAPWEQGYMIWASVQDTLELLGH